MSGMKEVVKEYSNGEMTIFWKPKACIHAGECVKRLPKVYNPKARPWIQLENATTQELKDQVDACPSGALSFKMIGADTKEKMTQEVKVEALENGPLLVSGTLNVINSDGSRAVKKRTTAFCRCGASNNKPYCDGAHVEAEFKG